MAEAAAGEEEVVAAVEEEEGAVLTVEEVVEQQQQQQQQHLPVPAMRKESSGENSLLHVHVNRRIKKITLISKQIVHSKDFCPPKKINSSYPKQPPHRTSSAASMPSSERRTRRAGTSSASQQEGRLRQGRAGGQISRGETTR